MASSSFSLAFLHLGDPSHTAAMALEKFYGNTQGAGIPTVWARCLRSSAQLSVEAPYAIINDCPSLDLCPCLLSLFHQVAGNESQKNPRLWQSPGTWVTCGDMEAAHGGSLRTTVLGSSKLLLQSGTQSLMWRLTYCSRRPSLNYTRPRGF